MDLRSRYHWISLIVLCVPCRAPEEWTSGRPSKQPLGRMTATGVDILAVPAATVIGLLSGPGGRCCSSRCSPFRSSPVPGRAFACAVLGRRDHQHVRKHRSRDRRSSGCCSLISVGRLVAAHLPLREFQSCWHRTDRKLFIRREPRPRAGLDLTRDCPALIMPGVLAGFLSYRRRHRHINGRFSCLAARASSIAS